MLASMLRKQTLPIPKPRYSKQVSLMQFMSSIAGENAGGQERLAWKTQIKVIRSSQETDGVGGQPGLQ